MESAKEWDADLDPLGTFDQIHAVGAFALYYNRLEMGLYAFFQRYVDATHEAHSYLYSTLYNRQRVDFIKVMASARETPELAASIHKALRCFDVCAENRNLLLHALPEVPASPPREGLRLLKGSKAKPGLLTSYEFSLESIRAAALAVAAVEDYIYDLMRALRDQEALNPLTGAPPPELPLPPPQPRKLSLSRLPEAQQAD